MTCRPESDPVTLTGLAGVLDGATPAVELVLMEPEECTILRRRWMFFDPAADQISLGSAPTSGVLEGDAVISGDRTLTFSDFDVTLELEYPGSVASDEVRLSWVRADVEVAAARCLGVGGWDCSVEE